MNNASWRTSNLVGLVPEAALDPSSSATTGTFVATPTAKAYAYAVANDNGTSCEADRTTCTHFTLTATLEVAGSDGETIYTKQSV
jgi:hypothetical protein